MNARDHENKQVGLTLLGLVGYTPANMPVDTRDLELRRCPACGELGSDIADCCKFCNDRD